MKNMIKMYYWGLICCFFSFCWACTDDSEDVNSTDLDIDWFVVEDSENPIDHLIYTVYEKYGVPIYYDDTIGKRDRGEYNMSGEKIIFYKVLQPEYTISSHTSTLTIKKVDKANKEALKEIVEILRDEVLLLLPEKFFPLSFYVVDELKESGTESSFYKGLETTILGNVVSLASMPEEERVKYSTDVLARLWAAGLMKFHEREINEFFRITNEIFGANIYDKDLTTTTIPHKESKPEDAGMLYYHTTYLEDWDWWTVKTPTQEEDLRSFLIEIINGDQEVFLDKYKDCRYVLAKYNYLRELMNKILIGNKF